MSAAFLFCALTNDLCVAKLTTGYGISKDIYMLKNEFTIQVQATPPIGIRPGIDIHPGETPQGGLDDAPAVGLSKRGNPGL